MTPQPSPRRVAVTLPPWLAEKLEAEVKRGRFASLEDAVLAGAKLVAGLGPRAKELLKDGADADQFVGPGDQGDGGEWL
jgi:Arc/MetJ-type ribon-helix-helix transcriptional regulator